MRIDEMLVPIRMVNCLKKVDIETISDLTNLEKINKLISSQGLGIKTALDIIHLIAMVASGEMLKYEQELDKNAVDFRFKIVNLAEMKEKSIKYDMILKVINMKYDEYED